MLCPLDTDLHPGHLTISNQLIEGHDLDLDGARFVVHGHAVHRAQAAGEAGRARAIAERRGQHRHRIAVPIDVGHQTLPCACVGLDGDDLRAMVSRPQAVHPSVCSDVHEEITGTEPVRPDVHLCVGWVGIEAFHRRPVVPPYRDPRVISDPHPYLQRSPYPRQHLEGHRSQVSTPTTPPVGRVRQHPSAHRHSLPQARTETAAHLTLLCTCEQPRRWRRPRNPRPSEPASRRPPEP